MRSLYTLVTMLLLVLGLAWVLLYWREHGGPGSDAPGGTMEQRPAPAPAPTLDPGPDNPDPEPDTASDP